MLFRDGIFKKTRISFIRLVISSLRKMLSCSPGQSRSALGKPTDTAAFRRLAGWQDLANFWIQVVPDFFFIFYPIAASVFFFFCLFVHRWEDAWFCFCAVQEPPRSGKGSQRNEHERDKRQVFSTLALGQESSGVILCAFSGDGALLLTGNAEAALRNCARYSTLGFHLKALVSVAFPWFSECPINS